jgi:hypothetical protein
MCDQWFSEPAFDYPSWQRHNLVIMSRKKAE